MSESSAPGLPFSRVDLQPVVVPPAIDIGQKRPDLTPDRKPQALSIRMLERVKQISAIAESPTDGQILQVARRLLPEGVQPAVAKAEARRTFENFHTLLDEQSQAEQAVKLARGEALRASRADFAAKKEALHAAIGQRDQARQTVRTSADWFKDTGIQVDPSQRPLTGGEVSSKQAAEFGYEAAKKVSEAQAAARAGVEKGRQTWIRGVEAGRNSLSNVVEGTRSAFDLAWNAAKNATQAASTLEAAAQSRGRATLSAVGQRVRGIWQGGREVAENTAQKVTEVWEAGTVWAQTNIAGRVGAYTAKMQELGQSAHEKWGNASGGIVSFVEQQTQRVLDVEKQVAGRISANVSQALEKGKIALGPAWEAVGRERQSMREGRAVVIDKIGIIATQVSEAAHPFVDPVIDKGRDVRDAAIGFGKKGIEGAQALGRRLGQNAFETGNGILRSLQERYRDLRVRANQSRNRMNLLIGEVTGGVGSKFKSLKTEAGSVAERGRNFVGGLEVIGGKVMLAGREAGGEVREWFVNHAATAAETLKGVKEATEKGLDALGRYWELYSIGRWKDLGLSREDISDRMKLLRAATAASVKRAATIGAATGLDGVNLASRLVRDPRGRLLIGAAALAFGVASHPQEVQHIIDGIQNGIQGMQSGGMDFSNISSFFSGGEVHASVGAPDLGSLPNMPGVTVAAAPDVGVDTGFSPAPEADFTPSLVSTENVIPQDILDAVVHGQPIEPQALRLAQEVPGVNPTEAFSDIMKNTFFGNLDNFRSTAEAIINGPGYSALEKAVAQNQLNAIRTLQSNPNIDPGSVDGLALLRQAAHFWRQ